MCVWGGGGGGHGVNGSTSDPPKEPSVILRSPDKLWWLSKHHQVDRNHTFVSLCHLLTTCTETSLVKAKVRVSIQKKRKRGNRGISVFSTSSQRQKKLHSNILYYFLPLNLNSLLIKLLLKPIEDTINILDQILTNTYMSPESLELVRWAIGEKMKTQNTD